MTNIPSVNDFEAIARALKEREAEQKLIQTGSTADEPIAEQIEKAGEYALGWPYVGTPWEWRGFALKRAPQD